MTYRTASTPIPKSGNSSDSRCKICTAPTAIREEAEQMLIDRKTGADVHRFLESKGLKMSRTVVLRHRSRHLPVTIAAREALKELGAPALAKDDAAFMEAFKSLEARKLAADVNLLDHVATMAYEVATLLLKQIRSGEFTVQQALLMKWTWTELRECVIAKHELTTGKGPNEQALDGLFGFLALGHPERVKAAVAKADERIAKAEAEGEVR